jgi:sugar O-acyltransferase (sialic acid O-acetyltransferase NeuD family)
MDKQQSNLSMATTNSINIIGASGHGKVIIEIAEANNIMINHIYDDDSSKQSLLNKVVLHTNNYDTTHPFITAIGNNNIRKIISNKYNLKYTTLIHPSATISTRALIDSGTVVMAGVSINSDVKIGKQCIINTNASIDHDCIIEDFAHISPNAGLAGKVLVGEGTHIGINACVIQGVTIGKWATIGAGAVIIRDIPDYAVVVGNPGKIIKYNNI